MRLIDFLLELFFPRVCVNCKSQGELVCDECIQLVRFLQRQRCPKCMKSAKLGLFCSEMCKQGWDFDQLLVCLDYDDEFVRKLIWQYKYRFVKDLGTILAEILRAQIVYLQQFINEELYLVPIPTSKKQRRKRGFSQVVRLAEKLSYEGLEICDALFVSRDVRRQGSLNRKERLVNMEGAIGMKPGFEGFFQDKIVILLDDVATTCSTLNEGARVLKELGGAKYVCGLVIARKF